MLETRSALPIDHAALTDRLRRDNQAHLLAFWDELTPAERETLAAQIAAVDFEQLARLFRDEHAGEDQASLARRAKGPPAIRLTGSNAHPPEEARARGAEALRAGRVGVIIVAGGQGTRLGFDHPKGMYPIGPVSGASLFQIFCEAIGAVGRRYGAGVPLYVMTSPATDAETRRYFAERAAFGLAPGDVRFFCQGTMPAVDARTGRVLLAGRGRLALSPDGHGGVLAALEKSGCLADMRRRGLTQIFYMQVDNPLAPVCDPTFIGYHLLDGSELTTLVVAKQDPSEKVGNVVEVDGRMRIIEYSDLPAEAAERRAADGSLALWAGNTAVHVFDVAFLERMAADPGSLPFHRALKKVATIDDAGRAIEPAEPNAVKFERFVFDLLPKARRALAVEGHAWRCFAPLKNEPGAPRDSPERVRAQMSAVHAEWLRAAGVEVTDGVAVEISPRLALDAEELRERLPSELRVAGARVTLPRYFC